MVEEFLTAARKASVFVVAGMGGLTSAFHDYTVMMLDTLVLLQALKVPTVLFGQGIGPFDDDLREKAADVLRKVDYIALREGRYGPALLRAWDVPEERWSVTGDDAVELAFGHRREPMGRAIGVNLRVSNYSAVNGGERCAAARTVAADSVRARYAIAGSFRFRGCRTNPMPCR